MCSPPASTNVVANTSYTAGVTRDMRRPDASHHQQHRLASPSHIPTSHTDTPAKHTYPRTTQPLPQTHNVPCITPNVKCWFHARVQIAYFAPDCDNKTDYCRHTCRFHGVRSHIIGALCPSLFLCSEATLKKSTRSTLLRFSALPHADMEHIYGRYLGRD